MVKQAVPLQPMEYHGGAGFHAAARQGDHGGAGGPSPMEAAACGQPTPDQFGKDCIPWEGPHSTGDESDREGAAEKKRYRLTITPIPLFPCAARGEEVLLVSFLCFSLL